ncbi:hypothetical protein GCM10018987_58420 [Streptomyces cremeus]
MLLRGGVKHAGREPEEQELSVLAASDLRIRARDCLMVHNHGLVPAIVFVATSGCTWQQLPSASFGPSGATAHRRFSEWSKARVWAKLHRVVLDELGARGELDWSRCAIDSVNMRAVRRGA